MSNRNVTIILAVGIVCLWAWPAAGYIYLDDGKTYNISWQINDSITVDEGAPNAGTTVNIVDNGEVSGILQGYNNSKLSISGGSLSGNLYAYDNSEVTVSAGSVGSSFYACDNSVITLSGGSVAGLYARDYSDVLVSGVGINGRLFSKGGNQTTIVSGSIGRIETGNSGLVKIYGGFIENAIRPGMNSTESIIEIYGSNFAVDGSPVGYCELTSILNSEPDNEPSRLLTGTLQNGNILNNQFYIGGSSKIVLVPEPAMLTLLTLGGILAFRRNRRRVLVQR